MEKEMLRKLIQTASGEIPAETVIKNCKVLDVFSGKFTEGDIALCGGQIAGVGEYHGETEIDAEGRYAVPGFIDSHIHIESSYLCPEELGRLLVPHGGTTIIADPHEIVNVCGIEGLDYMMEAAENTALDIQYMLPSCVPATPFENAGATVEALQMGEPIKREKILGLGEFMNFPGVLSTDDSVLDKLLLAKKEGKLIDGHSPGLSGLALNGYAAARIQPDCAIAVDVTWASDAPGTTPNDTGDVKLGGGPVLCMASSVNKKMNALLRQAAEDLSIPLQWEIATGRTGTDGDTVNRTGLGIPMALVSIPLRYMHSSVEVGSWQDLEQCIELLSEFLVRLGQEEGFDFCPIQPGSINGQ